MITYLIKATRQSKIITFLVNAKSKKDAVYKIKNNQYIKIIDIQQGDEYFSEYQIINIDKY
ncbi:MAG: hypothetical protein HDT25_02530 [Ruminococcus sp.]|nr:hypothetical protein [Ruminococcus sp.]